MDARLDEIERRLERIEKACEKMTKHVDFVEHVYTVVRRPLSYLLKSPQLIENKNSDKCNE